jgi:hypothetical protein
MKWLWIIVAVIASISAGVCYEFYQVKSQISYTFDFGSVIDAIALLLVVALVEYAYLKRSSEKRADTDLLLAVVADAKGAFNKLEEKAQCCENGRRLTHPEQVSLNCAERELSNTVLSIEKALGHCNVALDKLDFGRLKDARVALKDSLTDTPYPGPYAGASLVRVRVALMAMRDELTRMAFAINRR